MFNILLNELAVLPTVANGLKGDSYFSIVQALHRFSNFVGNAPSENKVRRICQEKRRTYFKFLTMVGD